MDTKTNPIPPSELIINSDGSIFHLHLKPEQLADRIILVGDPDRVTMIGKYLSDVECDVSSREFHSITGRYAGKRLTILSHGIGGDNMDIVINELDALANIDFSTRLPRETPRVLTMVRIGTSGGLQPWSPIGTYVAAERAVGFDGVPYFYADTERVRDLPLEAALRSQLSWRIDGLRPYAIPADPELTDRITQDDIVRGITIATCSFYGAQGRSLRLPLADPDLNAKVEAFEFDGRQIGNFEMESASLAALAALLGHRALTVCCVIAGRVAKNMNVDYKASIVGLIEKVLERI
mgnify:FL=1